MIILIRRSERREIIPEVLLIRDRATTLALAIALNEPIKRVRGAARSDLDILTYLGGVDAGLSSEIGFRYLVLLAMVLEPAIERTYRFRRRLNIRIVNCFRALSNRRRKPTQPLRKRGDWIFLEVIELRQLRASRPR